MLLSDRIKANSVGILYASSIAVFLLQNNRNDFTFILFLYLISFASYYLFITYSLKHIKSVIPFVFLLYATTFLNDPFLSEDYFRFIWDGELLNRNINPYDFRPEELVINKWYQQSEYMQEVYAGMSELSRHNYTCYPFLNQIYFTLGTFLFDDIKLNLITFRLLLLLTYLPLIHYSGKLLRLLDLDENKRWIVLLNPLWLIETSGNIHFEGVMMSFMIIAVYFLFKHQLLKGAVLLAAAVQIKLIPLIILPFFYRLLGFRRSLLLYIIVVVGVLCSSLILLNQYNIANFLESLSLYYRVFEFNSFVYHIYLQIGHWRNGLWMYRTYGFHLTYLVIFEIAGYSFIGDIKDPLVLLKRFVAAFAIYLFLSTTVHPWYLLPLLMFSVFTNYTFPVLWSFLIFLSYSYYSTDVPKEAARWLMYIEYIILLPVMLYELITSRPVLKSYAI